MFIFLYKTTNIVNNKFYIGIHATDDLNDEYYGSGVLISKALKKYGKENFKREILEFFENREDAFKREEEIVNELLVEDENCYNMCIGGKSPPTFKGHTEDSKRKISNYINANREIYVSAGKKAWSVIESRGGWTKEEIAKSVESRKRNNSISRDMSRCHTKEALEKRSKTRKERGITGETKQLKDPAIIFKRTRTKLLNRMKQGLFVSQEMRTKYHIEIE